MISFKQFLEESYEKTELPYAGITNHKHDLGTHHLHVTFNRPSEKWSNKLPTQVDFMVQKKGSSEISYNRNSKIPSHIKPGAAAKVRRSIEDYIKERRPKGLMMTGNTDRKKKMYAKFGNYLAKKYRGKRKLGSPDSVEVNFPHHKGDGR